MIFQTPATFRAKYLLPLTLAWAVLCLPAQAARKDVVVMNNGDHFTGEVKRLEKGMLYLSTPYTDGNIGLDWKQVKSVESTATYRITLNNGQRLEGKIVKNPDQAGGAPDFLISEATEEVQVPSAEIAVIDTKKSKFWNQLQGNLDLGYSYTSGNGQSALNVDTSAAYVTKGWGAATSFDSTFSGQSGASKTNREDLQSTLTKFLNRNSYAMVLSDFLHSSQQDLTLRTTLGGAYGRYLRRSTNTNLSVIGGIVFVDESFDTRAGRPSNQGMEAVVGLDYNFVRFNFGQFESQVLIFPGLTDSGRVRMTTNNLLTIKLRNNFHLDFTLWDNFDSRPPATAKQNELGISSGIGWSF